MKDTTSMHKKVQEMCDCYATNDPLKEMSGITGESDAGEAAVKWVALAALHGVTSNAEKISLTKGEDGEVRVVAEYRLNELPSPGREVGSEIFEALRQITHIEGDKGQTDLALGIRDSSIDLKVKIKKRKKGGEKIKIVFP